MSTALTPDNTQFQPPDAAELLIKEARVASRRRRLRGGAVVLVVAAVVVAVAGLAGFGSHATPSKTNSNPGLPVSLESSVTPATSQLFYNPVAIAARGPYVWVLDNSGGPSNRGAVYRIDSSNGQTVRLLSPLFDVPNVIYSDGNDVWIANQQIQNESSSLLKLDIATGQITRVHSAGTKGAYAVTSNGFFLWTLNNGSVLNRTDIATGTYSSDTSVLTAGENSLTSDGKYVWVAGDRLLRVSKATNKVVAIDLKQFTDTSSITSSGNDVWFRSGNKHIVEMNATTDTFKSFYNAAFYRASPELTTNGRYVWLTNNYAANGNDVLQLDSVTGNVTEIHSPLFTSKTAQVSIFAIASKGSKVWVTVQCQKLATSALVACGTVDKINP